MFSHNSAILLEADERKRTKTRGESAGRRTRRHRREQKDQKEEKDRKRHKKETKETKRYKKIQKGTKWKDAKRTKNAQKCSKIIKSHQENLKITGFAQSHFSICREIPESRHLGVSHKPPKNVGSNSSRK